jgi:small subunit ribosomal protein S2
MGEAARGEMPFVTERWLGGTLTNFKTVRSRLSRPRELRQREQRPDGAAQQEDHPCARASCAACARNSGPAHLSRIPARCLWWTRAASIWRGLRARRGRAGGGPAGHGLRPSEVDIAVPANDDSIRAVSLLSRASRLRGEGVQRSIRRPPEDARWRARAAAREPRHDGEQHARQLRHRRSVVPPAPPASSPRRPHPPNPPPTPELGSGHDRDLQPGPRAVRDVSGAPMMERRPSTVGRRHGQGHGLAVQEGHRQRR